MSGGGSRCAKCVAPDEGRGWALAPPSPPPPCLHATSAVCRLPFVRPRRPASRPPPRLGGRVLRLRVAEGAAAADAVVFGVGVVRTFFTPERTRRILAGRRESAGNVLGGAPRHRDAVLLLLGGAAVHRVRDGRRAAGRDVLVPHLRADGQRGRAGAALRPVRLEGGGALSRDRAC